MMRSTPASPSATTSGQRLVDFILAPVTGVTMLGALYMVFVYVPSDKAQGIVQRIFYFHVPIAIMTFVAFGVVAAASALFLWRGARVWDRLAHASAEIGMLFCSLVLITGPIWAKPVWGTWWTWDARLTSTLILWLIYAGYLMMRSVSGPGDQGGRYAAILGIVGFVDVPIINRSVYWWRTIHPAVLVTREGGSGLADPRMQWTLGICFLAVLLLFLWLLWVRNVQAQLHDALEEMRHEVLTRGDERTARAAG